jgi:hypothetical protein
VILHLLSLNPIVLVKSSAAVFSLDEENEFLEVLFCEGKGCDGAPYDQLLVN